MRASSLRFEALGLGLGSSGLRLHHCAPVKRSCPCSDLVAAVYIRFVGLGFRIVDGT